MAVLSDAWPVYTRVCVNLVKFLIYDSCTLYESERLDKLQRKASLLCTGAFRITGYEKVLKE